MLAEIRQPEQDHGEGAARFPGAHHVDKQRREHPPVLIQSGAETAALVDALTHLNEGFFQRRIFGLLNQRGHGIHHGQTRGQEGGKLPRHDRQILRTDPAKQTDLADTAALHWRLIFGRFDDLSWK